MPEKKQRKVISILEFKTRKKRQEREAAIREAKEELAREAYAIFGLNPHHRLESDNESE